MPTKEEMGPSTHGCPMGFFLVFPMHIEQNCLLLLRSSTEQLSPDAFHPCLALMTQEEVQGLTAPGWKSSGMSAGLQSSWLTPGSRMQARKESHRCGMETPVGQPHFLLTESPQLEKNSKIMIFYHYLSLLKPLLHHLLEHHT